MRPDAASRDQIFLAVLAAASTYLVIGDFGVRLANTSTDDGLVAEDVAGGTLALACVAIAALIVFGKGDRIWRGWFGHWAARVPARLKGLYAGAVDTSALIASPLQFIRILAITAIAFALDCAAVFSAIEAFGWELPFMAPVTVLVPGDRHLVALRPGIRGRLPGCLCAGPGAIRHQ